MHGTAIESFRRFNETYLSLLEKPKVVDIGSLSLNGEIKSEINPNAEYIGVDLIEGPNVDVVLKDPYKFPFEDNSINAIISISTFEHSEFFWLSYLEILRVLKPDGLLFLNVPSNGHFHRHDTDNWRFYPDSSVALKKWGIKNNYNPEVLEHFTLDQIGRDIWNDHVSVTIKDEKMKTNYPNRIIDKVGKFRNGRTDQSNEIINKTKYPQDQDNWGWRFYFKVRKFFKKIKINH